MKEQGKRNNTRAPWVLNKHRGKGKQDAGGASGIEEAGECSGGTESSASAATTTSTWATPCRRAANHIPIFHYSGAPNPPATPRPYDPPRCALTHSSGSAARP